MITEKIYTAVEDDAHNGIVVHSFQTPQGAVHCFRTLIESNFRPYAEKDNHGWTVDECIKRGEYEAFDCHVWLTTSDLPKRQDDVRKKKYRVYYTQEVGYYYDVEAVDKEQARYLADCRESFCEDWDGEDGPVDACKFWKVEELA